MNVLLDLLNDERWRFTIGTTMAITGTFWLLNIVFSVVYKFDLFKQYKIQAADKFPDSRLIWDAARDQLFGHFVLLPVLSYTGLYPLWRWRLGDGMFEQPLPPTYVIAGQIVVYLLAYDTLFFWLHRLLHHRAIYKHIHKKHHAFKTTISISTAYAHPLEDLSSSAVPILVVPLLLGCHPYVLMAWLTIITAESVDAHCGYQLWFSPFSCIPFRAGAKFHDYHHSHNVGNYGMFWFWDRLCGTDKEFVEFEKRKRDQASRRLDRVGTEALTRKEA
eukprot:TRINITY_DN20125_c0_g1_i1.p1 TRINITY_DN20125_c0_g1~~TRINITY_DN20125_c0_g1_i1.p1  ORF type:complete len:275 (-),score=47.55 TRINITY_DN20125_c0_g1_i1:88-912(-)